ncbi:Uncharacterised protein [Segatella copri]|nr:Uncharacterised protein [Segatella copri]
MIPLFRNFCSLTFSCSAGVLQHCFLPLQQEVLAVWTDAPVTPSTCAIAPCIAMRQAAPIKILFPIIYLFL